MSGFEIVGVVLGALPLAVKVAQGYMTILSAHKAAKRGLIELIQDLRTEEACLRNTCEILLTGVAPRAVIDKLVDTPFGPEWAPFEKKLRLRLWRTHGEFMVQATELLKATQELQEKLCIYQNSDSKAPQSKLTNKVEILRELKRNSAFTLRKKDYDAVLDRIKAANSVLETLAGQNYQLEPERKQRSQARVTRLVRELARELFGALRRATTCRCIKPHNACLELNSRGDVVLLPDDTDDMAAKAVDFHVVLESHGVLEGPAAQTLSHWDNISIRVVEPEVVKEVGSEASPPATPEEPNSASKHGKRSKELLSRTVRWSKSISFRPDKQPEVPTIQVEEMIKDLTVGPTETSAHANLTISNLCQSVMEKRIAKDKCHTSKPVDCYGYIADSRNRRFGLYPRWAQQGQQQQLPDRRVVTLRQVLEDGQQNKPLFNYLDRLEVALAVSVSILHLYSTPWLSHAVTLDNIVFLREGTNGAISDLSIIHPNNLESTPPYRSFIAKTLVDVPGDAPESSNEPLFPLGSRTRANIHIANLAILSLGALLIQIIIGETVGALEMTGNLDADSLLSKYNVGTRLLSQIRGSGGMNYEAAVNWCLVNAFKVANLKNDKFCDEYYTEVVARLERDAQYLADD